MRRTYLIAGMLLNCCRLIRRTSDKIKSSKEEDSIEFATSNSTADRKRIFISSQLLPTSRDSTFASVQKVPRVSLGKLSHLLITNRIFMPISL